MYRVLLVIQLLLFHTVFAQNVNPWKVTAAKIDPGKYYGVTVANGMVGVVSSPEPFKVKEIVLAGAYDLYGRGRVSNFIPAFNSLQLEISVDGKKLSGAAGLSQQLDMRHASLQGKISTDKGTIEYKYYALRHLPFNLLLDVSVTASKEMDLEVGNMIHAPESLHDIRNLFTLLSTPKGKLPLLTATGKSPTGKLLFCASNSFIFDLPAGRQDSPPPSVAHSKDSNRHSMKFRRKLRAGETFHFSLVGSIISSAHHADPLNEAERLNIFASLQGSKRLIEYHNKAWDELWKSDIIIEGDEQAQQDVHNMLYHLYSFVREGTAYSPSPMGLSGLGYNGHVFWDSELWMLPPLLVLHPELAKSMLEYRFQRLEAAKQNARMHGYKGAMFPWESAETGFEDTPVWALSGPFEHHITACVAIASWNYFCVTGDTIWLREKGFPIISAAADFWASRVERNERSFDIKNVVGADEWAENVDNDAFTNAAAKVNLKYAKAAAILLNKMPDPDWELVEKNIPILTMTVNSPPGFRSGSVGITKEHATYDGEPIKQADVNLLAYPLKLTHASAELDLWYYSSRVPAVGTPAMTQAIFALLYARIGEPDSALKYFNEYKLNLLPPFNVMAETKGGTNPYFATGAGGFLQTVMMGFAGIDITENGIEQERGIAPRGWKVKVTGVGREKRTIIR